jgi:hypothetical protein
LTIGQWEEIPGIFSFSARFKMEPRADWMEQPVGGRRWQKKKKAKDGIEQIQIEPTPTISGGFLFLDGLDFELRPWTRANNVQYRRNAVAAANHLKWKKKEGEESKKRGERAE